MSDRALLLEIITALRRDQLQRMIDAEAVKWVVDSTGSQTGTDLEIRFSIGKLRVIVTPSDVAVIRVS